MGAIAKEGFKDVVQDDRVEEGVLKRNQEIQLKVIENQWITGRSKGMTVEGARKA